MKTDFYLYKRGKVWYVRIKHPVTGEILSAKSTGQTSRPAAQRWATEEALKLQAQHFQKTIRLREWAERFFGPDCPHVTRLVAEGNGYSLKNIRDQRSYVLKYILTDVIASKPLDQITKTDILAFRDRIIKLKGRTRTTQRIFATLKLIINEADYRGMLQYNPARGIKSVAYEQKRREAVTLQDIARLLASSTWKNHRYWRATLTAALTGMRVGEIRGLLWEDLVPETGRILIRHNLPVNSDSTLKAPKWGKERVAVYPQALQSILEPHRGKDSDYVFADELGRPMSYRWLREAFAEAAKAAGVEQLTFHGLRHSLQTALRDAGVPDEHLRTVFGWTTQKVQDMYTHRELYSLHTVEQALARLFEPVDPLSKHPSSLK